MSNNLPWSKLHFVNYHQKLLCLFSIWNANPMVQIFLFFGQMWCFIETKSLITNQHANDFEIIPIEKRGIFKKLHLFSFLNKKELDIMRQNFPYCILTSTASPSVRIFIKQPFFLKSSLLYGRKVHSDIHQVFHIHFWGSGNRVTDWQDST